MPHKYNVCMCPNDMSVLCGNRHGSEQLGAEGVRVPVTTGRAWGRTRCTGAARLCTGACYEYLVTAVGEASVQCGVERCAGFWCASYGA